MLLLLAIVVAIWLGVKGWRHPKKVGTPLVACCIAGGSLFVSTGLAISVGILAGAIWVYWLWEASVTQSRKKRARQKAYAAKRYNGVIRSNGVETWRCSHHHLTLAKADQCTLSEQLCRRIARDAEAAKREAERTGASS